MKPIAAYLLLTLGGNTSPSASDIKSLLETVGIDADSERLDKLISELEGKDINQLILEGQGKLASVPSGGVAAAGGASAGAAAGGAAPAAEKEEEKKEEEKEESDDGEYEHDSKDCHRCKVPFAHVSLPLPFSSTRHGLRSLRLNVSPLYRTSMTCATDTLPILRVSGSLATSLLHPRFANRQRHMPLLYAISNMGKNAFLMIHTKSVLADVESVRIDMCNVQCFD
jgi:large subunit ribosomal protein LP2